MKKIAIIMGLILIVSLTLVFNSNSKAYALTPTTASMDVNNDGVIDSKDLAIIYANYNEKRSDDKGYQAKYDLNNDGIIDLYDMTLLSKKIGTSIPSPTVSVQSVALNKTTDTLTVGNTDTLTATVNPSNATNRSVTWSSSNSAVAQVDNAGKVTAVSAGTVTITATTSDGNKTASCTVTVNNPVVNVTSISLNKTEDTMSVGVLGFLSATIAPSNATNQTVRWTTSNPKVATVDNDGDVISVSAGTAVITATTVDGGYSASCTVTVNNPVINVTSVSLNKTTDTLTVGDTDALAATVAPSNATNQAINWTSSNSNVATVDNTGKVTAVSAGTATITATTADGSKTASCTVTVNYPVVTFKDANLEQVVRNAIYKPTGTIYTSDVMAITSLDASYNSIKDISGIENLVNLQILKLNNNQISDISALKGLTNLKTLYLSNNQINDISKLQGLTNLQYLRLSNNQISDISVLKGLTDLQDFESSNNQISDISALQGLTGLWYLDLENNQISDISALQGLISLWYLNLKSNQIKDISALKGLTNLQGLNLDNNPINQVVNVTSVSLNKTTDTLTVGDTDALAATVTPSNATNQAINWTSSNSNVATVDNTGKVNAVGAGTAVITATTVDGGYTSSCTVTVNSQDPTPPTLNSISIDKNTATSGDNLTVAVNAQDDISGIKNINVWYTSPSGSASKYASLYSNNNGTYSGNIYIGSNDGEGSWKVSYVYLTDNAGNSVAVYNSETNGYMPNRKDLSGGDFTVNGTISDSTPPTLNSISIDKNTGTSGDNLTVTVNAQDDISGIKNINVWYTSPSGSASKYASLYSNNNGTYSGNIYIGSNDGEGSWKVSYVYLTDNAGNSVAVYNSETNGYMPNRKDLSGGDFTVNGTISDSTPPTLNGISIDKNTGTSGDNLTVTVNAQDDISGIKNINVWYTSPSGSASKYASLYSNNNGTYSGNIYIGSNDGEGSWKVSYVYLTDNAGNSVAVYNSETNGYMPNRKDLSGGDFTVTVNSPVVNVTAVSLNKTEDTVQIGNTDTLVATVSPNNATNQGINWTSSNSSIATVDSTGKVTGISGGMAVITATSVDRGYTASCIVTVTDKDTTPPTLNSISIDKNVVTTGDNLTVTVNAQDYSGISYIVVCYTSPSNGATKDITLFPSSDGTCSGNIPIEANDSGLWEVSHVDLTDSLYNNTSVYNSEVYSDMPNSEDLSNCNFTVI